MKLQIKKMRIYLIIFLAFYSFTGASLHCAIRPMRYCENGNMPWGADADLIEKPKDLKATPAFSPASQTCQSMIRFFQVYISPIDGPRSSFIPTSSQYALLAIQKHGVFKGIAMGCDRLMRENGDPWVYRTINFHDTQRKHDLPR